MGLETSTTICIHRIHASLSNMPLTRALSHFFYDLISQSLSLLACGLCRHVAFDAVIPRSLLFFFKSKSSIILFFLLLFYFFFLQCDPSRFIWHSLIAHLMKKKKRWSITWSKSFKQKKKYPCLSFAFTLVREKL